MSKQETTQWWFLAELELTYLVSPFPALGIRSIVVVFGRRSASLTGINSPVLESLPRGKVFDLDIVLFKCTYSLLIQRPTC